MSSDQDFGNYTCKATNDVNTDTRKVLVQQISKWNIHCSSIVHLTIIPRARMGSESIAHETEGRMGYWLRGHEGESNNCFSKIQLVGQKYRAWKNFR